MFCKNKPIQSFTLQHTTNLQPLKNMQLGPKMKLLRYPTWFPRRGFFRHFVYCVDKSDDITLCTLCGDHQCRQAIFNRDSDVTQNCQLMRQSRDVTVRGVCLSVYLLAPHRLIPTRM